MGRFIIILLLLTVGVFVAATYLLGAIRRLFGFMSPPSDNKSFWSKKKANREKDDLLYSQDGIHVYRGEDNKKE